MTELSTTTSPPIVDTPPVPISRPVPAAPMPDEALEPPTTWIRPPVGWQLINVRELWRYRELLFFLTWRDVKVRYKQTVLGAAWAILQPLMMMVVFTIFFGRMAKLPAGNLPYPIFVFAGLLPWTFFSNAVSSAANSVVGSERLITKIYFPRLTIPFAAVGAAVVDLVVAFGVLLVLMACYHVAPTREMLLVPFLSAVIALAALGVGTFLAALNVSYRDFKYVLPFMIQLWMFATPTVYMQPPGSSGHFTFLRFVLSLNPMTALIGTFRALTIGGAISLLEIGLSTAIAFATFLVGCFYFRRAENRFADVI